MNKKFIIVTIIVIILIIATILIGIMINRKEENQESLKGDILVTYFSLPETTGKAKEDSTITVNGETLGNTQYIANLIRRVCRSRNI